MQFRRGYEHITRHGSISLETMSKYWCFLLIPLIGLCFLFTVNTASNSFKLVQILFRHGERSPLESYPLDPHKDHKWPGGWNQLSNRGKLEEYNLGLQLAERYKDFLPQKYHLEDVLVQSSYADRCIMSAQLVLAGLFPPIKDQIWNTNLMWQPIPVHSIPRFIDNKIALKKKCSKYDDLLKEALNSERIQKLIVNNTQLFDYITKNTGYNVHDIGTLETLYNTLEIEKLNGLQLPDWTKSVFPDKMKDIAATSLAIFTETLKMKKIHGGMLLKEILEHMNDKVNLTLDPNRSLFMYSGHDLTVVSLLRVLGFDELVKPEFGASVIIELHEVSDKYIVKFLYKANPLAEVNELVLEECGNPCYLEKFTNVSSKVIPSDWEKECQN